MAEATIEGRGTLGEPETASRRSSVNEYRTFSRKLAPALTATGGVLAILGGLGTWIRQAKATRFGENLKDVAAGMGYRETVGWVLAGLGVVAIIGAFTWFLPQFLPKLVPIVAAVLVGAITTWKLPLIDRQVNTMVDEATKKLGFSDFHAGFGWGAWLLLVSSVLLLLGAMAGILREMDLRGKLKE